VTSTARMPVRTALGIGLAQLLSLIPGTSRSAATILGGFALGCSREAATEFSFLLSVPVLGMATLYVLYKSRGVLERGDLPFFALGTLVAFVVAFVVIQRFLRYVAQHDFRIFAWYRIGFGLLVGLYYWGR
jgi:undecaprenyl-diphosphatase